MYFDDCQQPRELQRAISEFMKIQTGKRVSLAGKGSVAVPLIDEHTDQTLREGVAEAYAFARKMRNNYPPLSDVPAPSVVPLESLGRLSEWCERVMHEMPEKPAETEQDIPLSKRRELIAWLKNHPHSYGLTGGFIFLILFLVLGLFKAQWRQWCWGVAGLAFLALVLSLLGGRSR